jgi:parvulin-like peptidyl-prolyl isomerase
MGQGDAAAGEATLKVFPADYRTVLEGLNADALQLEAELSGQGCAAPDGTAQQAYYNAHKSDFRSVCLAHILVGTEAEADQLYAQLQAGANFADLAKANSTDSTAPQGGDLGCATKGSLVPEFDSAAFGAAPGVVTKPVQTQFGWHLILVDHFVDETFEQAQNIVERAMQSAASDALNEWLSTATGDAKVTVSSRYGKWDDSTNSVVARSAASDSTTTTAVGTIGP